MANKKISELGTASALTGSELVEVVQGGANVKTTTQDIADIGGGSGTVTSVTGTYPIEVATGTTTPVVSVVLEYVTPEQYGAVGDGVTNDSTAFQNAINSGKTIYVGAKTYLLSSAISIPSDSHIKGSGSLSILKTTSNISIFELAGINSSFENLTFLGNDTGTSQRGISAVGDASITILLYGNSVINCRFKDLAGAGIYGTNIMGDGTTNHKGGFYITNCSFISNRYGIHFDTQCEYNCVVSSTMVNNTVGVKMGPAGNNSFVNCNINDNTTGLEMTGGANDAHCVMDACKINHNTTGISINGVGFGYLFSDCMIYSNPLTIVNSTRIKFLGCDISTTLITSTSNTQLQFTNNRFYQTPTFTVTGNAPLFFNNTWDSGTLPSILNNTLVGVLTATPTATLSGFNAGSLAGDPSSLNNGDIWYSTSANALRARINGSSVSLGSGSLGDFSTSVSSSVADEIVLFDGTTGKLGKRSTGTGFAKLTSGVLSASASINLASEVGSSILPIANGGTGSTAGAWLLSGTSTLSGSATVTRAAANGLTFNGNWTAGADGDTHRVFTGAITGTGTTSHTFYGDKFLTSLTAGANNQILYGVHIAPTFASGGFTGLTPVSLHVQGTSVSGGTAAYLRAGGSNNSTTFALQSLDGAGSALFSIRADGTLQNGGLGMAFTDISFSTNSNSANNYVYSHNKTPDTGGYAHTLRSSANLSGTSGDRGRVQILGGNFNPSSGTATEKTLRISETVNQTSTASGSYTAVAIEPVYTSALGSVIGIDYNPTVTSVTGTHTGLKIRSGNASIDNGNITLATAGNGLIIKEGSNATMGVATLVAGTAVVSTTKVTANSRIMLTRQNLGTITVPVGLAVSARTASTSFTILSGDLADTSLVAWQIIEPAP